MRPTITDHDDDKGRRRHTPSVFSWYGNLTGGLDYMKTGSSRSTGEAFHSNNRVYTRKSRSD